MKLLYWIFTVVLVFSAMLSGTGFLLEYPDQMQVLVTLGYPKYVAMLLGVWKWCGCIALLLPRLSNVKVWAYTGFFFLFSGAFLSHVASGHPISDGLPALISLMLVIGSFLLREHRYN